MDVSPIEQTAETSKLIEIPKKLIRPFARAIRQSIDPQLELIDSSLAKLNDPKKESIKKNFQRITDTLNSLERAKQVKISTDERDDNFRFSEETEQEDFKPEEVMISHSTFPMLTKFMSAFRHNIGSPLQIAMGKAQGIQSQEGKNISNAFSQIIEIMGPFTNTQSQVDIKEIIITTDPNGNMTISPIL